MQMLAPVSGVTEIVVSFVMNWLFDCATKACGTTGMVCVSGPIARARFPGAGAIEGAPAHTTSNDSADAETIPRRDSRRAAAIATTTTDGIAVDFVIEVAIVGQKVSVPNRITKPSIVVSSVAQYRFTTASASAQYRFP